MSRLRAAGADRKACRQSESSLPQQVILRQAVGEERYSVTTTEFGWSRLRKTDKIATRARRVLHTGEPPEQQASGVGTSVLREHKDARAVSVARVIIRSCNLLNSRRILFRLAGPSERLSFESLHNPSSSVGYLR